MNKYSNKIIKFLEQFDMPIKSNYDNDPFINKLIDIFKNTSFIDLKMTETYNVPKIHDSFEYPLLYLMWKNIYNNNVYQKYFKYIPNINNFKTFIEWFRTHHHLIEMTNIQNTYNDDITDIIFDKDSRRAHLHKIMYNNPFISLDILQHMESEDIIYEQYENENVIISLYILDNNDRPDIKLISKIIEFMKIISKIENKLELTIFYGRQKKKITFPNILCPDNTNSGTSTKNTITIWRAEEFYKVLIHELVHFVNFDFFERDTVYSKISNILKKYINIDYDDRVNESYTEIIALIFHTIMMSVLLKKSFSDLCRIETTYSLFQVAKIICFFGGEEFDQLITGKGNNANNINVRETTSVVSYYIVKTFMLINIDKMIEFWSVSLEQPNETSYKFKLNNKNYDAYISLYQYILSNMMSKDMYKYRMMINDFIDHINHSINKDSFIYNTMIMSCLQIE